MRTKKIESTSERMAANLRSEADKLEDEAKSLRRAAYMLDKTGWSKPLAGEPLVNTVIKESPANMDMASH